MSSKIAMSNGIQEQHRCAYCMIEHRKYPVISNCRSNRLIPQKQFFLVECYSRHICNNVVKQLQSTQQDQQKDDN